MSWNTCAILGLQPLRYKKVSKAFMYSLHAIVEPRSSTNRITSVSCRSGNPVQMNPSGLTADVTYIKWPNGWVCSDLQDVISRFRHNKKSGKQNIKKNHCKRKELLVTSEDLVTQVNQFHKRSSNRISSQVLRSHD